jgi:hypothetical protein
LATEIIGAGSSLMDEGGYVDLAVGETTGSRKIS